MAAITIGGLQSIAAAASRIVPAMAFIYFLSTIGVLLVFADKVPAAVSMILKVLLPPRRQQAVFLARLS